MSNVASSVGSSIDLDEDVSKGPPAALRPPPSLLALEDAGGSSDGIKGGEDGVFKVRSMSYENGGRGGRKTRLLIFARTPRPPPLYFQRQIPSSTIDFLLPRPR